MAKFMHLSYAKGFFFLFEVGHLIHSGLTCIEMVTTSEPAVVHASDCLVVMLLNSTETSGKWDSDGIEVGAAAGRYAYEIQDFIPCLFWA